MKHLRKWIKTFCIGGILACILLFVFRNDLNIPSDFLFSLLVSYGCIYLGIELYEQDLNLFDD